MSALSGTAGFAADGPRATVGGLSLSGGWTARLFLEPLERPAPALRGDEKATRTPLGMNVQLSRQLDRKSTLAIEATNLFDRAPAEATGLAAPVDGRGVLIRFRRSF